MKLKFNLSEIIVSIDDNLVEKNRLKPEALKEMINAFESLPMEQKMSLIGSISVVNESSDLTLTNVKVGQMVETVSDGTLGMIIKINKKNILVKTAKGILTGSPTAFKSSKQKDTTLLKNIKQNDFEKSYEGTFLEVFVKNEWHKGITVSNMNKSGKIKVVLYNKNSIVNLTEQQINDEKLVKVINKREVKVQIVE